MIRILQIIGSLNMGGAENFIVNLYRCINKEEMQFDFLLYDKPHGKNLYDEVERLGAKIYYVPSKREGIVRNYCTIKKIIEQNKYEIVWKHTGNCFSGLDIIAARFGKAQRRILHSHSSNGQGIQKILHYICRPLVDKFVTDCFACGSEAGKWMFRNKKYIIIPNGIDTERYRFRQEIRSEYRNNLRINDKMVIGHVGRFVSEKNHAFIIDVFKEVCNRNKEAVLMLIGAGELQEKVHDQVKRLELSEKVLFLNTRDDVPELMQAMDVLFMPSLFEGLPVTLIEAQAAGLPCVVSENITREVDLTGNIKFYSLDGPVEVWADAVEHAAGGERYGAYNLVKEAGYDVRDIALKMQQFLTEGILLQ